MKLVKIGLCVLLGCLTGSLAHFLILLTDSGSGTGAVIIGAAFGVLGFLLASDSLEVG